MDAQSEELNQLESEQHGLLRKRESLEKNFPGLVENQEMLKDVRNRKQTNDFLQQIYDVHQKVVSKTNEIEQIKNNLPSIKQELTELRAELQIRVEDKNNLAEEVHGSQT